MSTIGFQNSALGKMKGLIIVFSRNEKLATLRTLCDISACINLEENSVIFVDDFSTDGTIEFLLENQGKGLIDPRIAMVAKSHEDEAGIRGSIKKALSIGSSDFVIPLPGHHMFDATEVNKVISSSSGLHLVIGIRENLFKTRPIGKYFASKVFSFMFRQILGLKEIRDPHGLISYPKELLEIAIPHTSSHENHVIPILLAKSKNTPILQIGVKVRENHKVESKISGRPNTPRLSHVSESVRDLKNARGIVSKLDDIYRSKG